MKSTKIIQGWIAGVVLLLVIGAPASLTAQTPQFDQLRSLFDDGMIFEASFVHEYQDSYTGEQTRNEGTIWIGRESYRVEGSDQVMVVDGEISRVYDRARNRLLISTYEEEEDDFAPSRMLQGVDESYRVSEEQQGRFLVITLRSDDPFAIFGSVEITLNGEGVPLSIHAVDQAENNLITEFRNGRFREPSYRLFELEVPESAERVDLRH